MTERTPEEWEGLARMAAARLYAGERAAPDDAAALKRHPEIRAAAKAARDAREERATRDDRATRERNAR